MSLDRLTRREAGRIMLGGSLAAAAGLAAPGLAMGQPANTKPGSGKVPAQAAKSFVETAMKKGRSHDWILKPTIHVQAYQQDAERAPKDKPLIIGDLSFKTAAVLFPVLRGTASSEMDIDAVKSELTFNDRTIDVTADYNESYHAGVRLGRWEMRDKTGKEVELKLELPMTCWETVFDEKEAAKAVWPADGKWPRMAQATLQRQAKIDADSADAAALKALLDKFTEGKPAQSVSPLLLAKTLCGRVVETFQPSGNGEDFDKMGSFTGLVLPGPAETIRKGNGSPHDIASVLVGLYRAAGLPARLVIGYDESENKGEDSGPFGKKRGGGVRVRSWAEFCLVDHESGKELWVPVDPVRMRRRSSQLPRFEQPWKFFGTHDELDDVMPFAFHFIPPTTVISYGYAFWGWFTTPTTQVGEHWVRFQTQTAPKRPKPKQPPQKSK